MMINLSNTRVSMYHPVYQLLMAVIAFIWSVTGYCQPQQIQLEGMPRTVLQAAGKAITVELALTDAARRRGLMHRAQMGADEGMLFVFPKAKRQRFWMKNTLLDLDIIFLDDDGTVLDIQRGNAGQKHPGVVSSQPCRLVLELNADWAKTNGLKTGDQITLPDGLFKHARL